MSYPSTIDAPPGISAFGTSPLTSPDHALDHRTLGSAVIALETVTGTTAGTGVLGSFAAGDLAVRHKGGTLQHQLVGGTINNLIGTTPTFVNATLTGGTRSGGLIGTAQITGGTATSQVINTPTISAPTVSGGTFNTPVINGGTYGTINAPASSDLLLLPAAGSVMQGAYKRQGGTSNDYSVGGTTNFNETGVFMQFGAGIIGTLGGANSTVITFPVAFSQDPILITTANDETDTGDILYTFVRGVSTTTGTVFSNGAISGAGLTFNWLAIGKR